MKNEKKIELEHFLDISQEMLGLAQKNDWDKLPELEVHRKKIMESFFESESSNDYLTVHSKNVEQIVNDVLLINQQIERAALQQKVSIGQQLHGLKKKQNVHSAYMENS